MHPDLDPRRVASLLRELPDRSARPYGFAEFERRCRARARATRIAASAWALAALMIAAGLLALGVRLGTQAASSRAHRAAFDAPAPGVEPAGEAPAALLRARVMEHWLASLPSEPAVVRVGTRAAVTRLEDRIAQVDDLLSAARAERAAPARLTALQQERTRLVGTLVQVRYAETLADESR